MLPMPEVNCHSVSNSVKRVQQSISQESQRDVGLIVYMFSDPSHGIACFHFSYVEYLSSLCVSFIKYINIRMINIYPYLRYLEKEDTICYIPCYFCSLFFNCFLFWFFILFCFNYLFFCHCFWVFSILFFVMFIFSMCSVCISLFFQFFLNFIINGLFRFWGLLCKAYNTTFIYIIITLSIAHPLFVLKILFLLVNFCITIFLSVQYYAQYLW